MTPEQLAARLAAGRGTIDQAREALNQPRPSLYELADMASRIGALEWHLGELLRLIDPAGE